MPKYSLLAGDTNHISFSFHLHKMIKMSKQQRFILHTGVVLTLAKCSPYSFYSACGNRECYGSFQKRISKLLFQMSAKYILFLAKLKGEGKPFLEGTGIDLSSKLSLIHMRVMLTIVRVFINPFLLCLWEKRTP